MLEFILKHSNEYAGEVDGVNLMNDGQAKRLYGIVLALVAIVVLLSAFASYAPYGGVEMGRSLESVEQQQTLARMPGLPPFANINFDVVVTPPIVTVPASGGSAHVLVELTATNLTVSETLVLETHANIPGYSANFNTTSVTLNPGGSMGMELTVSVPNGVQAGSYPMSIVAKGENTQGGGWLLINVGSSQTVPPP